MYQLIKIIGHSLHDLMTPAWATNKTSYTTRFKPKRASFYIFQSQIEAEVHPSCIFSSLLPLFFFLFPLYIFSYPLSLLIVHNWGQYLTYTGQVL